MFEQQVATSKNTIKQAVFIYESKGRGFESPRARQEKP